MKRSLNNKGRIIPNFKLIVLFFMLCTGILLLWVLYPENASSGPYLNSAHGNSQGNDTGYGVKRSAAGFPADYTRGLCAHCHEQHAKIGGSEPAPDGGPDIYLLLERNFNTYRTEKPYSRHDNVCFYCHIGTDTYQTPAFSNYSYSYTFGGCSAIDCPAANIFDTFNILSYHNLYDVWSFITGKSGSKTFATNFPAANNPCSGCHNVHIAQKSCGKPSGSFDTTKSAISKPSDHGNLWGNSAGEKMSNYTTGYQSPYYNSATTYEPDGSNTSDPSKLPDYVSFCTDCHNATNIINSTLLVRPLYKIDWANEMHGGYAANYCSTGGTSLLAPPYDGLNKCGQYVLACTDCHEPHGSPNNFLVRKWVNNGLVTVTQNGAGKGPDDRFFKEWVNLCGKCHIGLNFGDKLAPHHTADIESKLTCTVCHGDPTGEAYKACSVCHFHGNWEIPEYGRWIKPLF